MSANIGIGGAGAGGGGNGLGGTLPSFSVLGGTNSLVSVDALQEFRIQTSTYAPEFGRTPGGQISIVTRSGTNQFHGTAFDYLRNEIFDANNWFNGYTNNPPLPKPKERQNDFGGTIGGPILKDRTFFFFSYEGLRLRLPETTLTTVPDASFTPQTTNARLNATPSLQPYFNAFPLPNVNSPEIFVLCDPATDPTCPPSGQEPSGSAAFNASYSNPASLDAYSLRIDHKLRSNVNFFGRYNYSPSQIVQRGANGYSLNMLSASATTTQTGTVGANWAISPLIDDDLRFNYSRTNASNRSYMDNFGGAVPLGSFPFPSPFTIQDSSFAFDILSLQDGIFFPSGNASNTQRQINIVDSLSIQRGSHSLKVGIDFRHLFPVSTPIVYGQQAYFLDIASAQTGGLFLSDLLSSRGATLSFNNLSAFAQDTWRALPRLTFTYGLRWDVDFTPSVINGPSLPAVTGFNLNDFSKLALAPEGTPPFKTTYGNIAPRIGAAYQYSQHQGWETVLRGGFGVFYDLVSSEAGNNITVFNYPFGASNLNFVSPGNFPLSPAAAAPPPISAASLSTGTLYAFDPSLKLPYTLQWNLAVEQSLGGQQTLKASYIGSVGRRLLQSALVTAPNPSFGSVNLVTNLASSNYNALQLQFQRRLSRGLQALASYTWAHSIDTASAGSSFNTSNQLVPGFNPNANRGSSDFDVRNGFTGAATYDIPSPKGGVLMKALSRGWSLDNILYAWTAPPVNVIDVTDSELLLNGSGNVRPDFVPGQSLYLFGSQYPGGKASNPAAFVDPPLDPSTGLPFRQGTLGRNALRAFGAVQWDFAVHRDFALFEALKLQFRAEMFNIMNHPNFGPPAAGFDQAGFGLATQMLGQYLNGGGPGLSNAGSGGFDPLYQIGGPRSIQFALKLIF